MHGPADRLLVAGLLDLKSILDELRGNVLIIGGLMASMWLHLRPIEGISPRATADMDLGIDRRGLGLTATSERVRPLLEAQSYEPLPGDEGFRFRKSFGAGEALLVDLFVAKGTSRQEPPMLEKNLMTLAAPGLAYALSRGPYVVDVAFVDGATTTALELPLPRLDAAFVLKGRSWPAACGLGLTGGDETGSMRSCSPLLALTMWRRCRRFARRRTRKRVVPCVGWRTGLPTPHRMWPRRSRIIWLRSTSCPAVRTGPPMSPEL